MTTKNQNKGAESKEIAKKPANAIEQFAPVDTGYIIDDLGEITQWVKLPEEPFFDLDGKTVPFVIEGVLLGRSQIEDEDDNGNPIVRYFYSIRTIRPVPVEYKDENKVTISRIAEPGEIVAIGGRAKLDKLNEWSTNGGEYQVILAPTKKIKIEKGRMMWLFAIGHKTLREPNTHFHAKAPF